MLETYCFSFGKFSPAKKSSSALGPLLLPFPSVFFAHCHPRDGVELARWVGEREEERRRREYSLAGFASNLAYSLGGTKSPSGGGSINGSIASKQFGWKDSHFISLSHSHQIGEATVIKYVKQE